MKQTYLAAIACCLLGAVRAGADPWSLSVVDETGKPVAANVRIGGFTSVPRQFSTDAAGHLRGDNAPSWGTSLGFVYIHVPGHAPAAGTLRAGENKAVLGAPRELSGRLLDDDGASLAGVTVSVNYFSRPDGAMAADGEKQTLANSVNGFLYRDESAAYEVRTDETGRYTLHDLPAQGTARVVVTDPQWQNVSVWADLATNLPAPDLRTRPAARLQGRVLGTDGAPLPNKRIFAESGLGEVEALTGADGHYKIGGLPAGKIKIELMNDPQTATAVTPPTAVQVAVGALTEVPDIRLTPGALLEIATEPVMPGAHLDVRGDDVPDDEGGLEFLSIAGPKPVRVPAGKYHIFVNQAPKGYIAVSATYPTGIAIDAREGQTIKVSVHLDPALVLQGIARDENGKPVAGASIGVGFDGTPAITGADGRFALPDLAPGDIEFGGEGGWDIVTPRKLTLPLTPARAAQPVAFTLRKVPTAPLLGRVVDGEGRGIPGAEVTLQTNISYGDDGGGYCRYAKARTDAAGKYRIADVRYNDHPTLTVVKPGYRFAGGGAITFNGTIIGLNGQPVPNPDANVQAADLVLQSLLRITSGRVLGIDGKPVAGALVAAPGVGRDINSPANDIARTDKDGNFKLSGLPEGDLLFIAGAGSAYAETKSASAELGDIALKPLPAPPEGVAFGRKLIEKLAAQTDYDFRYRAHLVAVLAPVDFSAALNLARSVDGGTVDARTWGDLIAVWALRAPDEARRGLPALLPQIDAAGGADVEFARAGMVDAVSRLLPHPEKAMIEGEDTGTAALRAWVRRGLAREKASLQGVDLDTSNDAMVAYRLCALAVLSHRLGGDDAGKWGSAALKVANRYDSEQIYNDQAAYVYEQLVVECGGDSAALLVEVAPAMRVQALESTVAKLADTDITAALRLIDSIGSQMKARKGAPENDDPIFAFGQAATAILGQMKAGGAAQAATALALARRVASKDFRPTALALAARLQPPQAAAPLFREAFANSREADFARGEVPRHVLSIALESDPPAGHELLQNLEDEILERPFDCNDLPIGTMAAADPSRGRVWTEWQWARALNDTSGLLQLQIDRLIRSMAAIDPDRALAMANSIPPVVHEDGGEDLSRRHEAVETLARYLIAPKLRHNPDFDSDDAD